MVTLSQKAKFLRGLLSGSRAQTGPLFVTFDVTWRCNLRCLGCLYHSPEVPDTVRPDPGVLEIPYELCERLCAELKAMGTQRLLLIGPGEPLLHPRIFDLIALGKRQGFEVFMVTNGTLLDEPTIRTLLDLGLDRLQVSLWAPSPEEHAPHYPGTHAGHWDRVVEALRLVSATKKQRGVTRPALFLHHPVNCYNYRSLDKTVDLACATGCNGVSMAALLTHRGLLERYGVPAGEMAELRRSLVNLQARLRELGLENNLDQLLRRYEAGPEVWRRFPCYIGWIDTRIRMDGTVMPCDHCDLKMGSLHERSFEEIWNGPEYQRFRRQALTRQGLAQLGKSCDCLYCCHLPANFRLHRTIGWLAGLLHKVPEA